MRQKRKISPVLWALAVTILAFYLFFLWRVEMAHGVEISITVEIPLPEYINPVEIEVGSEVGRFWVELFASTHEKGLRASGCYSPRINVSFKDGMVLILNLSCRGCQIEGGNFFCPQQLREEMFGRR